MAGRTKIDIRQGGFVFTVSGSREFVDAMIEAYIRLFEQHYGMAPFTGLDSQRRVDINPDGSVEGSSYKKAP